MIVCADLQDFFRMLLTWYTGFEVMDMTFKHEANRIYAEDETGELLAEITFPLASKTTVNITGTFVAPSLRGQGIGDSLIRAAIADIQSRDMKIILTCPFAKSWFSKHPEFAHLTITSGEGEICQGLCPEVNA